MKSITSFNNKDQFERYPNTVDMLAHVVIPNEQEDKVYLELEKGEYKYVLSAWFKATTTSTKIVGCNGECSTCGTPLARIAKVKITDLTTKTVSEKQTSSLNMSTIKNHIYRVDYAIYKENDGTYHAPTYLFGYAYNLLYYVAYPDITVHESNFTYANGLLTGGIFKASYDGLEELIQQIDEYEVDNTKVPSLVNVNNAIYEGHMTSVGGNILSSCNNVHDVYFDENISNIGNVFWACESTPVLESNIYIGTQVQALDFPRQFKIRRVIIPDENPYIKWDDDVRCVVQKELINGKIPIQTGGGVWDNDYLYIPSNYTIVAGKSYTYTTFLGRNTKIVNLFDYEGNPTGFKDAGYVQTLILPKVTSKIGVYFNGLQRLKNIIIPCKIAPLINWYTDAGGYNDGWGTRGAQYGYSILGPGNLFGGSLGWKVNASNYAQDMDFTIPKPDRNIYVLNGTDSERESWTERYDRGNLSGSGITTKALNYWTDNGVYKRDNIWHDITLKILGDDGNLIPEAVTEVENQPNKTKSSGNHAFRQYKLNYKDEYGDDGMRALINTFIPEGNSKLPTDAPEEDLS